MHQFKITKILFVLLIGLSSCDKNPIIPNEDELITILPEKTPLSLIPATFVSSAVSWAFEDKPRFRGSRISVEGAYTAMQRNWDSATELIPPPDDYFLLGVKLSSEVMLNNHMLHIGLSVQNLLNIRYRDYLDRLRYFSDEQGIDFRLNLRYKL